jgi:hypothetical protein
VVFHDNCGQLGAMIGKEIFQRISFGGGSDRRMNIYSLKECEMQLKQREYIFKECLDHVTADKSSSTGDENDIFRHLRYVR